MVTDRGVARIPTKRLPDFQTGSKDWAPARSHDSIPLDFRPEFVILSQSQA